MVDLDLDIPDTDYDESGDIPPFPYSDVPYPSFIRAPQYDGFVITGASDGVLPTQKAVKTYVDNKVATAGDWISIDENNEISAKGDTNPFLGVTKQVEKTLYAWSSSDENFPVIYTEIDELTPYPYYNSQHIALDKTSVISISDTLRYTYYFGTAEHLQNEINVRKKTEEIVEELVVTETTITYTQNPELNTTYTTTIFDSSDEVLPTQKAVFEFFNSNTIKYVKNTQSMKIGVK